MLVHPTMEGIDFADIDIPEGELSIGSILSKHQKIPIKLMFISGINLEMKENIIIKKMLMLIFLNHLTGISYPHCMLTK